ncbi:MAG: Holliday junction resolvase RuvX [Bacteroidetes bacterium]|nr:Holliday junction resolvase RuvX [Bacteroidota bacterium]MBK7039222.1 Holliday junction resolvase RuvX [Bacteroidota bacterium]MBK7587350.1 Holliday junction resolvase RuvX [Bacteroidota bacterium]MBK9480624.1 Holliday junction resolvase RuvX [Bacteroidota bacterium]HQW46056.1 Holliday junction resolvase RuvX [Chitinophagaceae bacterium]
MARILAIDYGKKRTGIAVSDPLQIIANGLTTVETKELIAFLKKYFEQEVVETVIIGLPKSLKNEATDATPLVMQFMKLFKNSFPDMPLIPIDERYTSKMAFQTMIDAGLGKKARQNKALIDEISATILLQGYMTTL